MLDRGLLEKSKPAAYSIAPLVSVEVPVETASEWMIHQGKGPDATMNSFG